MDQFFGSSLILILDVFTGLFFTLLMARFWLRAVRAPFYASPYQQIIRATNWLVMPLQKIVGKNSRHDWASLVLTFLLLLLSQTLKNSIFFGQLVLPEGVVLVQVLVSFIHLTSQLMFFVCLIYVILSWVQPQSPIQFTLRTMLAPMLNPLDRIIPQLGGLNFSVIILLLLIQIISNGLVALVSQFFIAAPAI